MTTQEKIEKLFSYPRTIGIFTDVRRSNGEWYRRVFWSAEIRKDEERCPWFGFETVAECVDHCLNSLKT